MNNINPIQLYEKVVARVFSSFSFNQSDRYHLFYRPDPSIISSSVFKATENHGSLGHPFQAISPPMFHWYLHIPFYPPTELFLNGSEFLVHCPVPDLSHSRGWLYPGVKKRDFFFLNTCCNMKTL